MLMMTVVEYVFFSFFAAEACGRLAVPLPDLN